MSGEIQRFTKGNPETVAMMNELVHAINNALRMTGDGFVNVQRSPTGTTLSLSMNELKTRFMNFGGGTEIRKAFASVAAGASGTIACFLDTDGVGGTVDVVCEVADGETDLNSALPRLRDGDMIHVYKDGDTWRSIMTFQASGPC